MEWLNEFENDVSGELKDLDADPRLVRRAQRLLERWQEKPGLGFPQIFEDSSELEAAYRFFSNPYLSFDSLLQPHANETLERCRRFGDDLLVIHDTSTFVFSGEREGLGFIHKNNRGFPGHFAFAVSRSSDETPVPLGVIAASTWTRTQPRCEKSVSQHKLRTSKDCESHRWLNKTLSVQECFEGTASPIHVMDREADIYDCTSTMAAQKIRFVVRAKSNRIIDTEAREFHLLFDALDGLPVRYKDTVTVSSQKASRLPDQKAAHPTRDGRTAEVCVTATQATIKRTRNSEKCYPARTLTKNGSLKHTSA